MVLRSGESQGQGMALFGAPRTQQDLPSLVTIFSQPLTRRFADRLYPLSLFSDAGIEPQMREVGGEIGKDIDDAYEQYDPLYHH